MPSSLYSLCTFCGDNEHEGLNHTGPLGNPWWTVCGVWPETKERWASPYQAQSAYEAEATARQYAAEVGGVLWVTNVFWGKLVPQDTSLFADDPDRTTEASF